MTDPQPILIAGRHQRAERGLTVPDRSAGGAPSVVGLGTPAQLEQALAAASRARDACAALTTDRREGILRSVADRIEAAADDFAGRIVAEVGKPIRDARGEVARAASTFRLAAAECSRAAGEYLNLDHLPATRGYRAITTRVPIGVCSLITPFNFPLNLAAHKVAPAIAAGCPFVLKPSEKAPLSALALGELLVESELPAEAFSVLPLAVDDAGPLIDDGRVAMVSFTGSDAVGWELARRAAPRRVALELGGNAACIVDAGADLDDVVARLLVGIFGQSGQSCISVQRVLIHRSLSAELRQRLVRAVRDLPTGDPRREETVVGPLIDDAAAERLEAWVTAARAAGARVLVGGERDGSLVQPTLLSDVPHDADLWACEAFGPVAVLEDFDQLDDALESVDSGPFGLQAGLFTGDLDRALTAFDRLRVGGLVVGDVPTFRSDAMPYGGTGRSGLGREGPRYAIEEMTEVKTLVLRHRS